jgi:micrococcal nuclease
MYEYRAKVVKVYDGDTITVDIDLGFNITMSGVKIRLLGIDTPEIRGGTETSRFEARSARNFVRERILGEYVVLRTIRDATGKFGRYLGIVEMDNGIVLNKLLVEQGLAEPYLGYDEHIAYANAIDNAK